jgi:hypothetical protein
MVQIFEYDVSKLWLLLDEFTFNEVNFFYMKLLYKNQMIDHIKKHNLTPSVYKQNKNFSIN